MIKVAHWITLVALFLIPFVPLYIANGMFFPFITGKAFAFRILVEIALGGYVLLALLDKAYRPKFSWTLVLYGSLVVWMALADFFATNVHKAFWSNFERMDGWVTLVHMFVFFVILGTVLTADKLWRKWWLFFLSGTALVCIYGLFQLAGMAEIHQGGARVDATFGNAAYLAVYLLFATAVALWQGIESKGWLRYYLFGLAALSAIIIFTTATRGAVLGLVGAVGLGAGLWMFEAGNKKQRMIAGGVLAVLIVLVGAFFALKETPFIKGDPTLTRIASISAADGSTRFTLWNMALKGVAERPVTGWGHEGFNYVFQKHYTPDLYAQEPWFDRAHSTYIDWLISGGIPALILFLGLLGSAVVALYRKTTARPERILLVSALAAYAFQAIFVFDNLFSYLILATLLAAAHSVSSSDIPFLQKQKELKDMQATTVAATIVFAGTVALLWMVNVPSMDQAQKLVYALNQSQRTPAQAVAIFDSVYATGGLGSQEASEQYIALAGALKSRAEIDAKTRGEIYTSALQRLGDQVARAPHDARLRIQYATGFRGIGAYDLALEQSALALMESPKKQTLMLERGYEFWESGDLQGARDTFVAMYELDTSFKELAVYAAAGEIAVGNTKAGDDILETAYGTTKVDAEPLVLAYFHAKDYKRLIGVLESHLVDEPTVGSYIRLASAYVLNGEYGRARATAQKALTLFPESKASIQEFIARIP
jgi:O-antigen ligase